MARAAAAAILAVIAVAVFANALGNGFVDDDEAQVLRNPWIQDVRFLPAIFTTGVWSFLPDSVSNYYRPLMHVVYMAAYHLVGSAPWGFHLVNLLFHAACTVLVFVLASRLPGTAGPAPGPWWVAAPFLAGLIFATHPIHTEAVDWVAALPETAFTCFFLLSLIGYAESRGGAGRSGPSRRAHALSVAAFLAALLFKETALTLPLALAGYDLAFAGGRRQGARRGTGPVGRYLPYAAAAGVYFVLRSRALPHGLVAARHTNGLGPGELLANVFPLFGDYLRALLLPFPLNFWHTFHPIPTLLSARGLVSLAATGLFAAGVAVAWRRDRVIFFALLLVAVPLLPALYIEALPGKPFAERYLYLPSAGFAIAAGRLLRAWLPPGREALLASALAPLLVLYTGETWTRNPVWKDPLTLFGDTVARSPDASLPRYNLAIALFNSGRVEEALEHDRLLVAADPLEAKHHSAMGAALLVLGRHEEAAAALRRALELDGRSLETLNDLGIVLKRLGHPEEAEARYREAIAIDPGYADAHFNLGVSLADAGRLDESLDHLRAAVRLRPDSAWYRNMLGIECAKQGLRQEAIEQFEAAIRLEPAEPAYRTNLDRALAGAR